MYIYEVLCPGKLILYYNLFNLCISYDFFAIMNIL